MTVGCLNWTELFNNATPVMLVEHPIETNSVVIKIVFNSLSPPETDIFDINNSIKYE